jgi:hypothetical protein
MKLPASIGTTVLNAGVASGFQNALRKPFSRMIFHGPESFGSTSAITRANGRRNFVIQLLGQGEELRNVKQMIVPEDSNMVK